MITVDGLRFTYPKAKTETLKGLSFSVPAGVIFGFLGPSGAGKSTTQKVMIGALKSYGGTVRISGMDAAKADSAYRSRLGIAFETPAFYQKLTGLENLEFFLSLYAGTDKTGGHSHGKDDPVLLLERLGLGDAIHKPVSDYSKGMKTRLNLARALAHRAPVLFLDEPTSGLDPASAKTARELIRERARDGAAVFLTTHDMVTADSLCDTVAFLVDGTIAAMDSPEALKRKYGRREVAVETGSTDHLASAEFPLDGLADNAEFQSLLRNPAIRSIKTLDATLDAIFIKLTGKELS